MRFILATLSFLMLTQAAHAYCFEEAGKRYGIDPSLLHAIAQTESGLNPKAKNKNRDGSYDLGLMQVNSTHLKRLKAKGITEKRLISEPCTAVMTGASILSEFIHRVGYNWKAVGAYNAGVAPHRANLRKNYIAKVWNNYKMIKISLNKQQKPFHTQGVM